MQLREAIARRQMLTAGCGQFLRVEGDRPSMMVVKLGCILGGKIVIESTQCGEPLYYSNYAISNEIFGAGLREKFSKSGN